MTLIYKGIIIIELISSIAKMSLNFLIKAGKNSKGEHIQQLYYNQALYTCQDEKNYWKCASGGYGSGSCPVYISTTGRTKSSQVVLKKYVTMEEQIKAHDEIHRMFHDKLSYDEFLCEQAKEELKIESQKANGQALDQIYEMVYNKLKSRVKYPSAIEQYFVPFVKSTRDLMQYHRRQNQGRVAVETLEQMRPKKLGDWAESKILPVKRERERPPPRENAAESVSKRIKLVEPLYDLNRLQKHSLSPVDDSVVRFILAKLSQVYPLIGFAGPIDCRKHSLVWQPKAQNIIIQQFATEWFVLTDVSSVWELHGFSVTLTKAKRFIPLLRKLLAAQGRLDQTYLALNLCSFAKHNPKSFDTGLWAIGHAVSLSCSKDTKRTNLNHKQLLEYLKLWIVSDEITNLDLGTTKVLDKAHLETLNLNQ